MRKLGLIFFMASAPVITPVTNLADLHYFFFYTMSLFHPECSSMRWNFEDLQYAMKSYHENVLLNMRSCKKRMQELAEHDIMCTKAMRVMTPELMAFFQNRSRPAAAPPAAPIPQPSPEPACPAEKRPATQNEFLGELGSPVESNKI